MLKYLGARKLGRMEYPYFECDQCETTYPVIDGVLRCNGEELRRCLCERPPTQEDRTDEPL